MEIFLLALLAAALALICAGYWLFFMGVVRLPAGMGIKDSPRLEAYSDMISSGTAWFQAQDAERVVLPAYDGTPLVGLYVHNPQPRGTVILFHGYRCDGYRDFSCVYKYYYDLGYSLLNVFQRAHGQSGGQYICFGVKERFDCRDWARYVCDRFGPGHDIFLGGISMGSSTVLMASELELPKSVRGIIADCGFTSPYAEFKEVLTHKMHLPAHPFIEIADVFCRLFAGFGFNDCSTVDAMRVNKLPVLFIHGEADNFVPFRFTRENFEACLAPKTLISVPNAGHGFSYLMETERCQSALRVFLKNNSTSHGTHGDGMELFRSGEDVSRFQ